MQTKENSIQLCYLHHLRQQRFSLSKKARHFFNWNFNLIIFLFYIMFIYRICCQWFKKCDFEIKANKYGTPHAVADPKAFSTCTSPIMNVICPPEFCITFIFDFSWVLQPSYNVYAICFFGWPGGGGGGANNVHERRASGEWCHFPEDRGCLVTRRTLSLFTEPRNFRLPIRLSQWRNSMWGRMWGLLDNLWRPFSPAFRYTAPDGETVSIPRLVEPYKFLNVNQNASREEIKKAFRRVADDSSRQVRAMASLSYFFLMSTDQRYRKINNDSYEVSRENETMTYTMNCRNSWAFIAREVLLQFFIVNKVFSGFSY